MTGDIMSCDRITGDRTPPHRNVIKAPVVTLALAYLGDGATNWNVLIFVAVIPKSQCNSYHFRDVFAANMASVNDP